MVPFSGVQEPVEAAVWYALNNYCYEDAIFIAERLHAEVGLPHTTFLLSTCYYRSGRLQQAKYLLNKERHSTLNYSQCILLYARCCLDLKEYKEGLLALNGLINLRENSEAELREVFGEDVGVAFLLLGKLKYKLQHKEGAKACFRLALKHNPFLWSAFAALCEIEGGNVMTTLNVKDYFKVTEYPGFLRPHPMAPPTSTYALPVQAKSGNAASSAVPLSKTAESDVAVSKGEQCQDDLNLIHSELAQQHLAAKGIPNNAHQQSSAFRPVVTPAMKNKHVFMTPDLFHNPSVGQAIASSTPSAPKNLAMRERLLPPLPVGVWSEEIGGGARDGMVELSQPAMGPVKLALDFGSAASKGSGRGLSQGFTPLHPSFGILSLSSEGWGSSSKPGSPLQLLDFSSPLITPSPQPLPPDYMKQLMSAPKSTVSRRQYKAVVSQPRFDTKLPTIDSAQSDTLHPLTRSAAALLSSTGGGGGGGSFDGSRDHHMTVVDFEATTPTSVSDEVPAGKAGVSLRRSNRLSASTNKRLSDHALHSTRASKSRSSTKKIKGVSFNPSSLQEVNQNRENLWRSAGSALQREGVVSEPESDKKETILGGTEQEGLGKTFQELLVAQQQALELNAMNGLTSLMELLGQVAESYKALVTYDLGEAVRLFQGLPPHHWDTPWVLTQVAHAYFAAERFKKAAVLFRKVHDMDPHRQEGMDLFSSCLWHLQKEVELSVLAHTLHRSNKLLPQGLCAMASLKNLQKDHNEAIHFLTKATQANPDYAYAHTLLGHEHWLVKDYERALSSFQQATTLHPRHYNAWYGMAHVYFAQENYRAAETYAEKVLGINGCSSIACTQMGLAQLRQSKFEQALETFDRALAINPYNPIPRFHKAKVLEITNRLEESLKELDVLAKSWPKEPNLYISKGKILKKMGRNHEASLQFSWALDFSRSGSSSQLREEIDQAYHNQNSLDLASGADDFLPLDDPSIEDGDPQEEEEEGSMGVD